MNDPAVIVLIGVAISSIVSAVGAAFGTGTVAKVGGGLLAKVPERFPQVLILTALPSSNALYGFLYGIIILLRTGLINGKLLEGVNEAVAYQFLFSALPVAFASGFSAIIQGQVGAVGIKMIASKAETANQAIILAALIESFAIFGLITSILIGFTGINVGN